MKKSIFKFASITPFLFGLSSLLYTPLSMADETGDLIEKGCYIAIAADCAACHKSADEKEAPFSGGYKIASPMGGIVASNITPSKEFGIGNWSEKQFSDAVRKGISANGEYLYPAMPYTSYYRISDDDIHALYTYFMHGVTPFDRATMDKTDLDFPFNMRNLMWGWNIIYANNQTAVSDQNRSLELNRGQYLVDALAHCSTCHTPRNMMMAEDKNQYLAGSLLGGWYAPNITSDKESGIGNWSQQDIAIYLKTGHVANKAQAAGPMGEAVSMSFRFMTDDDLNAIAAAIKEVPAIKTEIAKQNATTPVPVPNINEVVIGQSDQNSLITSTTINGAELYNGACASCHGIEGQGTTDSFYPSLTQNSTVNNFSPNNLVMTISEGIHRPGNDIDVFMPAFGKELNNGQIASVSNYVRLHFGNIDDKLTKNDVLLIRQGGEAPFLLKYINWLMAGGGIIGLIILWGIFRTFKRRH